MQMSFFMLSTWEEYGSDYFAPGLAVQLSPLGLRFNCKELQLICINCLAVFFFFLANLMQIQVHYLQIMFQARLRCQLLIGIFAQRTRVLVERQGLSAGNYGLSSWAKSLLTSSKG